VLRGHPRHGPSRPALPHRRADAAGQRDQATPLATAQLIHNRFDGAKLTILEAAHMSNVEEPGAFADAVLGFLTRAA
jgi:pimeloyl-ACP methyl ester carboxylesterase